MWFDIEKSLFFFFRVFFPQGLSWWILCHYSTPSVVASSSRHFVFGLSDKPPPALFFLPKISTDHSRNMPKPFQTGFISKHLLFLWCSLSWSYLCRPFPKRTSTSSEDRPPSVFIFKPHNIAGLNIVQNIVNNNKSSSKANLLNALILTRKQLEECFESFEATCLTIQTYQQDHAFI